MSKSLIETEEAWKFNRRVVEVPYIVSRGDELGEMPNVDICGTFFKELFDNIATETETRESPSKDSGPKANETEPQTEPRKKRSSIVILDDEEIEEFQNKSRSRRTLLKELSAARRLQAWYNDRYGQKLQLTSNNKANASDLLKHFFLDIRDTRKGRLGE